MEEVGYEIIEHQPPKEIEKFQQQILGKNFIK